MCVPLLLLVVCLSLGDASPPFFETYSRGLDFPDSPKVETRVATRADTNTSYRLPTNLSPQSYVIQLAPNFETDNYTGSVFITFNVLNGTDVIVIHKKEIEIEQTDIFVSCSATNYTVTNANSSAIEDQYFYNIYLNATLGAGSTCTLNISKFQSKINTDANNGFYLGKYTDEDGNEQKFAMTKFEPTHARRAFPCFDEPAMKAVFTVKILRPDGYNANSNTPSVSNETQTNNSTLETFNQTVKMSTYLVSFVVSKFAYTQKLDRHRIFGRPSEINSGRAQYTLEVANRSLITLEQLTNVPYAMEKMDQLAVPDGYFTAGAMEDWGLVTYREAYLFYYDNATTITYLNYMNTIISHEFSHQWFGDLVSPLWWCYLWLNEGFASYFEYKTVDVYEPTWEMMEQFVIKDTQYAMADDSSITIRHMNKDAQTPTEISALFDRVAYDKAGSVIHQLETIVTYDNFMNGLTIYLNNKSFGNAEPADLYNGIQTAVDNSGYKIADNLTVAEIMETWTENAGYPVLTVERNYSEGSVNFSQSRFLLNGSATTNTSSLWYIPINTATKSNHNFSNFDIDFFLTQQNAKKNLNLASDEWFLVNKGERGYYRVNYDETNWKLLTDYLNSTNYTNISKTTRAQLIDDSFNLARSGRLKYEIPLNLISLFSRDTDYIPYYSFLNALTYIDVVLTESDEYDTFKEYIVSILELAYNELGVSESDTELHVKKFHRPNIVKWACQYGLKKCQQDTLAVLRTWKNNTSVSPLTATLEQEVLCGALRNGTEDDWNFVFQQYVSSNISLQRTRFLNALGCTENTTILYKYFDLALNSPNVSSADRANIFSYAYLKGKIELEAELEYISNNLDSILNVTSIETCLTGIGKKLTTQAQIEKLEKLSQANSNYSSILSSAITSAKTNLEWCNQYLNQIRSWVQQLNNDVTTTAAPDITSIAPTTAAPETTTPADGGATSIFFHPLLFVLPVVFAVLKR